MRAIKIEPKTQTITEVEIDPKDTLHSIYEHLGVDCFDLVRIDVRDWIYLDDMGHYRDEAYGFRWDTYPAPLLHTAIIFGDQEETTFTVPEVTTRVEWLGKLEKINGSR